MQHTSTGRSASSAALEAAPSAKIPHAPGADAPCRGVGNSLRTLFHDFRREHLAFLVLCVYLVFEFNRLHLIYSGLDVIPWGKTLLFAGIVLAFTDARFKLPSLAEISPMAFFSLAVLLSMAFAYSPAYSLNAWVDFFGWFVVVILFASVINSRKRLLLIMTVYFLSHLKMAQHGFRSWAGSGFGFSSWGVTGSPGWFQNSGEFAMQMGVFLPLVLAYIATYQRDWSIGVRVFFYLFAMMAAASIVASNSRGGVLGLVIVGLWCLAYSRQRIKAFALVTVMAALVYIVMPPEFKARFETAGTDRTSVSRMTYWEYGKEAVRDNPVTGVGYKNWRLWVIDRHPELIGFIGARDRVEVIHNTYLEAATELGLLGLAAYGAILAQILLLNRQTRRIALKRNDRFLASTAAGLNGSLIVFMVPSYFMSVLYYPTVWFLLAFTLCASAICRREGSEGAAPREPMPPRKKRSIPGAIRP